METPAVNRTFVTETLRCMYHIYGYDALMKEIQFIHHLYSTPVSDSPASVPAPIPASVPASVVVAPDQQEEDNKKSITLHVRPKNARSEKPDEERCTALTNNGARCSFARHHPTLFCQRHREMNQEAEDS